MLDADIKKQLEQYLQLLEGDIVLKVSAGDDKVSQDTLALVEEIASMSSKITVEKTELERTPSFSVNRAGEEDSGIVFAGIPLGHEFTSLVLALLQVSGRSPKVEQNIIDQIKSIKGEYHFDTYVSLSCNNCPDVVQALNLMSLLNPGISHTMVEGSAFKEEVEAKDILAVPTVYLNGEFFESGRTTIKDILSKLGAEEDLSVYENKEPFDVLVIGGGPAGAAAAVYAARKGVRTGIIADRFGGQVLDTTTIENFISVKQTDGDTLASQLEAHVREYPVDIMDGQTVERLEKKDLVEVTLKNGAVLKSKTAIIATGARWRDVNVPGEDKFRTKGVANCTHCDAPIFAGKDVAVIGGGNSGIESAIDLAGVAKNVTVLEFASELKADDVLQERVNSLPNVKVITNAQTKEITGKDKVDGITYIGRETDEEHHNELEGVFVQIGLIPNTEWLEGTVEMDRGQIIVDGKGATSVPGVFAAGDCTNSVYKQIIISMGSGATAALGAFDYIIRN